MHQSILLLALGSSTSFVAAKPRPLLLVGASQVDGVATFNNYNTQTSTVCGKFYAGTLLQSISCHSTTNYFSRQ